LIDFLYRPGIEACEEHENGVYAIKLNRMIGRERERERERERKQYPKNIRIASKGVMFSISI
jgi:hypothetical protein